MPTNLYGPNDNFDLETSHALPALIRKFHEAKIAKRDSVVLWGTGEPMRELLYVDDLADACVFLMNKYGYNELGEFINIGTGTDISIADLAQLVKELTGFKGEIQHDYTKPDGTPRKLLDISKIRSLGWKPKTSLEDGIKKTYSFFTRMK
jgi:GDP-L-fucose synthase